MDAIARGTVDEQIFSMAIPEAKDVANHGPHRCCASEAQPGIEPVCWGAELLQPPAVHHRRKHFKHLHRGISSLAALGPTLRHHGLCVRWLLRAHLIVPGAPFVWGRGGLLVLLVH